MATISGSSKVAFSRKKSSTVGMGTNQVEVTMQDASVSWTFADAVDGCQILYSADDVAVAGSGGSATSYDLVSALLDPLTGTAQTWTKIKELWLRNNTTTAGATVKVNGNFITTVLLGGTTPYLVIGEGGWIHVINPSLAGYAVTATSGDIISVQGLTTAAVNLDFFIAGVGTVA